MTEIPDPENSPQVDKPEDSLDNMAWLLGYDSVEDLELEEDEELIDDD